MPVENFEDILQRRLETDTPSGEPPFQRFTDATPSPSSITEVLWLQRVRRQVLKAAAAKAIEAYESVQKMGEK